MLENDAKEIINLLRSAQNSQSIKKCILGIGVMAALDVRTQETDAIIVRELANYAMVWFETASLIFGEDITTKLSIYYHKHLNKQR